MSETTIPCVVCGNPGSMVHFPSVGRWTSTEGSGEVPVCPEHDPRRGSEFDLDMAKRVAESIELRREGRTRRAEADREGRS